MACGETDVCVTSDASDLRRLRMVHDVRVEGGGPRCGDRRPATGPLAGSLRRCAAQFVAAAHDP